MQISSGFQRKRQTAYTWFIWACTHTHTHSSLGNPDHTCSRAEGAWLESSAWEEERGAMEAGGVYFQSHFWGLRFQGVSCWPLHRLGSASHVEALNRVDTV